MADEPPTNPPKHTSGKEDETTDVIPAKALKKLRTRHAKVRKRKIHPLPHSVLPPLPPGYINRPIGKAFPIVGPKGKSKVLADAPEKKTNENAGSNIANPSESALPMPDESQNQSIGKIISKDGGTSGTSLQKKRFKALEKITGKIGINAQNVPEQEILPSEESKDQPIGKIISKDGGTSGTSLQKKRFKALEKITGKIGINAQNVPEQEILPSEESKDQPIGEIISKDGGTSGISLQKKRFKARGKITGKIGINEKNVPEQEIHPSEEPKDQPTGKIISKLGDTFLLKEHLGAPAGKKKKINAKIGILSINPPIVELSPELQNQPTVKEAPKLGEIPLQKKKIKISEVQIISGKQIAETENIGTVKENKDHETTFSTETETKPPIPIRPRKSKLHFKKVKTNIPGPTLEKILLPPSGVIQKAPTAEKEPVKESAKGKKPVDPIATEKHEEEHRYKRAVRLVQSVYNFIPVTHKKLATKSASGKSVKIVVEEQSEGNAKESQNKLKKKKLKRPKRKKLNRKNALNISRLSTKRPIGVNYDYDYNDPDAFDPLEAENIRQASTYKEWAIQAKRVLPSKAGPEIEKEESVSGMVSDILRRESSTFHRGNEFYRPLIGRPSIISRISRKGTRTTDEENPDENEDLDLTDEAVLKKLKERKKTIESPSDKIAKLRNVALHLSRKISYKKQIIEDANIKNVIKYTTRKEKLRHFLAFYLLKIQFFFRDLKNSAAILVWWKTSLKMIESTYGGETFLYFRWIRTVIFLNGWYLLIAFLLLVLPEYVHSGFIDIDHLRVTDLLSGEGGYTHKSAKFYYSSFSPTPNERYFHSSPFRFCVCLITVFVINSIFIGRKVSYFYHSMRLESSIPGASTNIPGSNSNSLMDIICAWDFSVASEAAAKLRHQIFARELKFVVADWKHENEEDVLCILKGNEKAFRHKLANYFGQKMSHSIIFWTINAYTLAISSLNALILYFLHQWRFGAIVAAKAVAEDKIKAGSDPEEIRFDPPFYILVLPSIYTLISAQTFIIVELYFSKFEGWKSVERKLFTILTRIGCFWAFEISVLYITRHKNWDIMMEKKICWEVTFGTEFYRLIVLQEIVNVIFTLILDTYPKWKNRRTPSYRVAVFDVDRHTVNIIYIHTLSGLAFVFCPLISLVAIIRLIITFYHERFVLLNLTRCNEIQVNLRISQMYVPYLTAFFISYIVSSSLNVILIFEFSASKFCGPFDAATYEASASEAFGHISLAIIGIFGSRGLHVSILCLMTAAMFIMRAWSQAYQLKMIKLHELLALEKKDRDFLMRAIYNIGKAGNERSISRDSSNSIDVGVETPIKAPDTKLNWKGAIKTLLFITLTQSTLHRTEPAYKKSKTKQKKAETVNLAKQDEEAKGQNKSTKIDLQPVRSASIRSRRLSNAEALYLASTELSKPHHATIAHKAIDTFVDLTTQHPHQNHHHHSSNIAISDNNIRARASFSIENIADLHHRTRSYSTLLSKMDIRAAVTPSFANILAKEGTQKDPEVAPPVTKLVRKKKMKKDPPK